MSRSAGYMSMTTEVMLADVLVETSDTATLVLFAANDRLDYRAGHLLTIDPRQFEALERLTAFLEGLKTARRGARSLSSSTLRWP